MRSQLRSHFCVLIPDMLEEPGSEFPSSAWSFTISVGGAFEVDRLTQVDTGWPHRLTTQPIRQRQGCGLLRSTAMSHMSHRVMFGGQTKWSQFRDTIHIPIRTWADLRPVGNNFSRPLCSGQCIIIMVSSTLLWNHSMIWTFVAPRFDSADTPFMKSVSRKLLDGKIGGNSEPLILKTGLGELMVQRSWTYGPMKR